jgi:hypothetical protein
LYVGDTVKIKTNLSSKYTSSNTDVATVSSSGKVTAKSAGTAKITVTAKSNKKLKKTVTITVQAKQEPTTEQSTTQTTTDSTTESTVTPNPCPTTETPTVEQPSTEKTTTEQPSTTEEPTTEQPSTQEPTIVGIEAKYRGDKVPNDLERIKKWGIDLKFVYSDGTKKDIVVDANNYDDVTYNIINKENIDEKTYVTYKVCYNNYETEMKIQVVDVDESIVYPTNYLIEYTGETLKEGATPNLDDISIEFFDLDGRLLEIEKDNSKMRLIKLWDYGDKYEYSIPYDYYFTDNNGNKLYVCIWSMTVDIPHE